MEMEKPMRFVIKREITQIMPPSGKPSLYPQSQEVVCGSLEELFEKFEKMYQRDKMAFDYLKDTPVHRPVSDESRHPGEYTFSLSNRLLIVRIENFGVIANALFGFKGDEKHGRWTKDGNIG